MKLNQLLLFSAMTCLLAVAPLAYAQTSQSPSPSPNPIDDRTIDNQLYEREQKIGQLTIEEQLKLRAAQLKAAEDPAVLAALEKRNAAIMEFRAALRAAVIRADPSVTPILDKISVDNQPGF
jgi:hypothetical protein